MKFHKKNLFLWIFYLSMGASLLLEIGSGPALGGTDVYIFKDAGCNLGLGYGFKSAFLPGYSSVNPEVFSSYAPGLPYLFGLFTSIFGCSGHSNLIFNWLLVSLVSVLLVNIIPDVIKNNIRFMPVALIFGFSLWKGNFEGDRPEVLSLILLIVLCRCVMSSSYFIRKYIAPFILGCIVLVHPYAGMASTCLYILCIIMDAKYDQGKIFSNIELYLDIFYSGMIATIPVAIVIIFYYYYSDVNSLTRFLNHASVYSSSILEPASYFSRLKHGINSYGILAIVTFISFLVSLVFSIVALIYIKRLKIVRNKYINIISIALTIIYILPIILYPGQSNYWVWSMFAIIIFLNCMSRLELNLKNKLHILALSLMIIFLLPSLLKLTFDYIGRYQTRESYLASEKQAEQFFIVNQEYLVGDNDLLIPASHYFILKNKFNKIINPNYIFENQKINLSQIIGFAMCGNNRSDNISNIESKLNKNFKLIDEARERIQVSILGYKFRNERSNLCNYFVDLKLK